MQVSLQQWDDAMASAERYRQFALVAVDHAVAASSRGDFALACVYFEQAHEARGVARSFVAAAERFNAALSEAIA